MTSQSSINYHNFIEIKQEAELVHNYPVIVQNAVPEFSQQQIFKCEPEENYYMEIDDQNNTSFVGKGIIKEEATNVSQNCLKISSVTQGFNADELQSTTGKKRGRKPKNVTDLMVTTKMKPKKKTRNVQKTVKNAAKLDKSVKQVQKSRKITQKNLEGLGDNLRQTVKNSEQNIEIFGDSVEVLSQKPSKTTKSTRNSKTKPQKPSKSILNSSKSSHSSKNNSRNPKITQLFEPDEEQYSSLDDSKIAIQKSQTSPSKTLKNAKQNITNLQKPAIKSESSTQSLQSSFIIDDRNSSQLKLKISKRPQKSLEPAEAVKKPRQRKKQPQNDLKTTTNIKQEALTNPTIKSELQIPPYIFPNDNDLELIGYEPKITKKRKIIRLDCDHCGKVFKSKYSIIWHMKEHMLTMPFNCKTCGKGFSYERSFKQHELTHAAKIKCEICSKSLKPHAMYYHMKYRHTNEKTHQCPLCPKAFKTKDNIARHMMRHNMEFPCSICGRKFAENSRLQMHLNMHENPEQFFCSICNKSFEHIDRHMKRLHAKKRERNLKCQYCEYASDSKQTLRRHEEMHEKRNEILQSKTRKRKIKLKIMEMKTYECKVCNVVLQTKSGYKSHLRHYHKGKDEVNAIIANEIKDDSSVESDNFVEIKVEKEEISVVR